MNITDHPIKVEVRTEYAAEHSDPAQDRYVFIYYISIVNNGDEPVQLISRYWKIMDASGQIEEVRGEGVIGEQPVIEPGREHFYNSFCILETPVGCMQGSYLMQCENGEQFDAPVALFSLAVPGSLN
ncbi:Co2+/Mg2+ efflux protein ApaG [Mariprofundus sp. NF]|uniref:Co2+/Mg2+ efflux protein ApaG n=1 Tax=Mariprofundus sp. NF TaxID=2608716 RepID=UPI0015A4DB01|nr:Co2+/Mg2+ efflux protein ApaG [Mariprofundus sp. NF]